MTEQLAAVVAALHEYTGAPSGGLRLASVIPLESGAWRVAGRLDRMGMHVERVGSAPPPAMEAGMRTFRVTVEGRVYEVTVEEVQAGGISARASDPPRRAAATAPRKAAHASGPRRITAPMPGKIVAVNAREGDAVTEDSVLLVLDAMKMENDIMAGAGGTVMSLAVKTGDRVNTGDLLAVIE